MWKYLIIILGIIYLSGCSLFYDKNEFIIKDFTKFSKDSIFSVVNKVKNLNPSTSYKYWECISHEFILSNEPYRGNVIVKRGDSVHFSNLALKYYSEKGFFPCETLICYSYIIAFKDSNNVDIIDSKEKLKAFIGTIDNIDEVKMVAYVNNLTIDSDSIIGGAYKKKGNLYYLYLCEYSSSPETYKSVKAILSIEGRLKIFSKEVYKKTNQYIMY